MVAVHFSPFMPVLELTILKLLWDTFDHQVWKYFIGTYKKTPWDLGQASPPLIDFIESLDNKDMKFLIPGAGRAYEAIYLYNHGCIIISYCS